MNYLMLNKDDITEVCGVITKKDVEKEIGATQLASCLRNGYTYPYRGKYVLVEEEFKRKNAKPKEEKFKYVKFCEGKRGTYYVSSDGEFFIKYNKSGKVKKLTPYMHNRKDKRENCLTISINKRSYHAKNIVAMLFLKGYQKGDIVCCKNNDPNDIRADNLKIIPKSDYAKTTYGLIAAQKVGLFEDGKLIRKWASARKCAKDMYCSYQMIMDICNNKWQKKEFDVRWL